MGSMGFLTNHACDQYKEDLHEVIYGEKMLDSCAMESMDDNGQTTIRKGAMVTLRMRLLCEIIRAGSTEPEQVGAAAPCKRVVPPTTVDLARWWQMRWWGAGSRLLESWTRWKILMVAECWGVIDVRSS